MDITELLAFTAQQNASDLHLSAGLPPMIRVDGDIRRINVPPMDHAQVQSLIYDIMNDQQRRDYEDQLETDFSFEVPGIARFRVAGAPTLDGPVDKPQSHRRTTITTQTRWRRTNGGG